MNRIYSYLYKFSFFNGLFESKIKTIEPIKDRSKSTLTQTQRLFHFLQRAIASKGYLETITSVSYTHLRAHET